MADFKFLDGRTRIPLPSTGRLSRSRNDGFSRDPKLAYIQIMLQKND